MIILLPLFSALSLYNSGILPTAPLNKWMIGLIYEALHLAGGGTHYFFVCVYVRAHASVFVLHVQCERHYYGVTFVYRCVHKVKYIRSMLYMVFNIVSSDGQRNA